MDAEAEAPILWPPDAKNWLTGKDPEAGKDWRREEKGTTEDEMVGWHHQLDGHEFEQAPGVGGWTGKPGVLQSVGLQIVGHDQATELHWTENKQWNPTMSILSCLPYSSLHNIFKVHHVLAYVRNFLIFKAK